MLAWPTICIASALASGEPDELEAPPEPEPEPSFAAGASVDLGYAFNTNLPENHVYRAMVPTPRTGELSIHSATAFVEHEMTEREPWQLQLLLHAGSGVDALIEPEPVAGGADGRYAGPEAFKHLGLANVGFRARSGTSLQGGLMAAPLGTEWFWPYRNTHHTASWTANGTPFYLMGLEVAQELPADFKVFGWLANGWQTIGELNAAPSYLAGFNWSPRSELVAAAMVYFGPDDADLAPDAWRVHGDAFVTWDGERLGVAAVWDVGRERLTFEQGRPVALWTGGGVSVRGTLVEHKHVGLDVAVRPEAWWDRDGRIFGVPQWLASGTGTISLRLYDHVLVRTEYRYDRSTASDGFFYAGPATNGDALGLADEQHTLMFALAGYLRHRFALPRE